MNESGSGAQLTEGPRCCVEVEGHRCPREQGLIEVELDVSVGLALLPTPVFAGDGPTLSLERWTNPAYAYRVRLAVCAEHLPGFTGREPNLAPCIGVRSVSAPRLE